MSALWILIIAVLGLLTIFLLLVIVLAAIMLKYGVVYTPPKFMRVILNLLTGELKEITPGLRPIIPGIHKLIRMVNCRPHVMGTETIDVVSSDGQPCSVAYQQTWWVDAFDEKKEETSEKKDTGKAATADLKKFNLKNIVLQLLKVQKRMGVKLKEGRAIKAATGISEEAKEGEKEEQSFERHASSNVKLETEATITSIIGSYDTDTLKSPDKYSIYCPECSSEIDNKDSTKCPNKSCKWGAESINISKDFKARLGWLTTVLLDKSLSDRFGIGCETKISNIVPPKPLQKALLDQQVAKIKMDIAEKKGEATQRLLAKESLGYGSLKDIGINANVAYIMGKLADGLSDLLEHLLKSAIPKESHPKGGETK